MRKTKIICTIGPASDSEEMLKKLMLAGMNVTRFNFSHDTHEAHAEKFKRVVKLRRELGLPVATLLDTKGPEIRLRDFKNGSEMLEKGAKFTLTTRELLGDNTIVSVSYKELPSDVQKGGVILIDDGLIGLRVDEVDGTEIHCTVENGGKVSNHKGVNIPGADLSMPFISDQDRSDIEFGCQMGFDYIAASFTRTAADIRAIREILNAHGSKMKIIAKIESVQGVKNIKEIFKEADGVMVARGDLGVEVPAEDVPAIQKEIIKLGAKMGKIVITATQMLDSMIHNPRPTRAEVTDVANAIYDGTMAIMLSGETAAGSYPVEAVEKKTRDREAGGCDDRNQPCDLHGRGGCPRKGDCHSHNLRLHGETAREVPSGVPGHCLHGEPDGCLPDESALRCDSGVDSAGGQCRHALRRRTPRGQEARAGVRGRHGHPDRRSAARRERQHEHDSCDGSDLTQIVAPATEIKRRRVVDCSGRADAARRLPLYREPFKKTKTAELAEK